MQICFYCDSIFSFGGVQRVLATISKGLSKKHDVTILTLDNPQQQDLSIYSFIDSDVKFDYISYEKPAFYEYIPCKFYSFLYKKILPQNKATSHLYGYSSFPPSHRKKLIEKINKNKYDVVVGVHAFRSLNLTAIKTKLKTITIGWLHTSYDAFFNNPGLYLWEQRNQFKYEMPLLDSIVVLTNNDKLLFKKEMNLNTTVIYNPLDDLPLYNENKRMKKFLAVGRLSYLTKGFDILIKAFALFAKKEQEWSLSIVGEGPEENLLRDLIKKHNLEKRVFIYPFTKNVEKYYTSASVFVLSSRWEGFGLVLIEAMAYGLPIIASDLPVIKELLGNKKNVLTFENENINDLADKLFTIINNCNLNQMGKESYEIAKHFKPELILVQWEELINKAIEERKKEKNK